MPFLGVQGQKILTDDGVVTASAENGLSEVPFAVDDWSYAFYFPGVEYETSSSSFVTIHVIVHSKKYTCAWLELRGYLNHVRFPLYFVDGVAEMEEEFFEPPDTLTASLYWEDNAENRYEFYDPEPEYGNYKEFPITPRDDYLTVEYVLD